MFVVVSKAQRYSREQVDQLRKECWVVIAALAGVSIIGQIAVELLVVEVTITLAVLISPIVVLMAVEFYLAKQGLARLKGHNVHFLLPILTVVWLIWYLRAEDIYPYEGETERSKPPAPDLRTITSEEMDDEFLLWLNSVNEEIVVSRPQWNIGDFKMSEIRRMYEEGISSISAADKLLRSLD